MVESTDSDTGGRLPAGFLEALCRTYADLMRRQRLAATPFVRWSHPTGRSHEFVWLGGVHDREQLMFDVGRPLSFTPSDELFDAVHKMYGTATLNPYEREILYGYPYVIGRVGGRSIRGPLLTISVDIDPLGDRLDVRIADDVMRFNSLPFRADSETDARDQALVRVMESTPPYPLTVEFLRAFCAVLRRELPHIEMRAALDGTLTGPPTEPQSGEYLTLVDQAALFVAPKTNYFLRTDLEEIAANGSGEPGALEPLLGGAGDEYQVEFTDAQVDSARLYFPFPSNRAQRRVALLAEDPTTRVVRVEGPPGTGKSLTIANLACHLGAVGKRVLITSQKDKALEVVDGKLRELELAELPMTLLRHDRESKRELLSRLDRVEKRRSRNEVETHFETVQSRFADQAAQQLADAERYGESLQWEDKVEKAYRQLQASTGWRRLGRALRARRATRQAERRAPETTDELANRVTQRRLELLGLSLTSLQLGLERQVSRAKRSERQVVHEMQDVLKRDQRAHRNFSMFDRLKQQGETARKLLQILPVWIVSPDDVARLFPCESGLFDVVIIDEASQVDLPSIVPIVYRAKKVLIFGDTKQMQSQRFAFMNKNVALEAWQQFGMQGFDPSENLHPVQRSLLSLAYIHAEEAIPLDEHFRSLPPIIEFSNERWYGGNLRIMTDTHQKRFGSPQQPIIELHAVEGGIISNGSQENEVEAKALVDFLERLVSDPDYAGSTIGVLCLFEEQVALVHELVTELIDPDEWEEHALVVVNPDGFQGDERDVILYSLSWDNNLMSQAALSARQMDTQHIQGMLNVAFTRARDEIHIFHSAPVESFGMAGGSGALKEWLIHCGAVQREGGFRTSARHGRIDSEFEAEVASALRDRNVTVFHQYPACGFSVDLMCALEDRRVAVECDGEIYHLDEHGNLRIEDVERQAILERAGWKVLRIPYRAWLKDPDAQIHRVIVALQNDESEEDGEDDPPARNEVVIEPAPQSTHLISREQRLIVEGLRGGLRGEDDLFRFARDGLGYKRLGPRIRELLVLAAQELNHLGLIVIEDGEYFLTGKGRTANLLERPAPTPIVRTRSQPKRASRQTQRSKSKRRRSGHRNRYRRY